MLAREQSGERHPSGVVDMTTAPVILDYRGTAYHFDPIASHETGWVAYKETGRAMSMQEEAVGYETDSNPLDSSYKVSDHTMDSGFGTLDELTNARPEMSILYIPEVNRNYRIRSLSGLEVDAYRSSITVGKGANTTVNQRGMRAKLVVLSLGNEDGSRMLQDSDIKMVQTWPSAVLERIFDRSRKFNGLTDSDTDDEKGNS